MDPLRLFVPLAKADAAQRLVYGSFDETPDRAGEVCDYATAKPAFESWSADLAKASDGKSLGNIRGQHSNIAAGKLVELTFDDMAKSIGFVAKIVDDNEWKKVEEGVYTGFSPGGRYAKRWQDGAHKRYTPAVAELSIVDVPCNPAATFTMVKADGAQEERAFVIAAAYEPGNDATKARADELAKAAGKPDRRNDYVGKARAELIAENAEAALAKAADALETPDPVAALDAALAKADKAVPDAGSALIDPALPEPFRDFAKAATAMRLIVADDTLAKGLWQVRSAASLLQELSCLQSDAAYEAKNENDGSAVPANLADVVKRMGAIVVAMAQEEVAELIAQMPAEEPIVVIEGDAIVMELATSIVDLVKADTALMEKAGKRNSAKDQKTVQEMHDSSVTLGATCEAAANKDALAAAEADRDRLAKALGDSVPRVEALGEKLEKALTRLDDTDAALAKANGRIAELEAQPMPPKGAVMAVSKEADGGLAKADQPADLNARKPFIERLAAMPPGPARAKMLLAATR